MNIMVARWYEDFPAEPTEMEIQARAISPTTFSLTVQGREYIVNKSLFLIALKEIGINCQEETHLEKVQNGRA